MSKSHTKKPKPCISWCKKGNSKKWKRIANKRVRMILKKYNPIFTHKSNFYKKYLSYWIIQGDFGYRPCYLESELMYRKSFCILYDEEFNENKEINMWKKIYYRK